MVYDRVNSSDVNNHDVIVSNANASVFRTSDVAITIPATVVDRNTGISYNVTGINKEAFKGTMINSLTIDAQVSLIPESMCSDCGNLAKVSFPSTVTNVNANAFKNCGVLTDVSTLENVKDIGNYAFQNCSTLAKITFSQNLENLGSNSFAGCTSLTDVDVPAKQIGSSAFVGCTSLATVTFNLNRLTWVGQSCFSGCSSLEAPALPSGVRIDSFAFENCTALGELTLPGGGSQISSQVFKGSMITKINWPQEEKPFKTFGANVFESVSGLTEVEIPNVFNDLTLPQYTFQKCTDLVSVKIDEGIETIGGYAFDGCTKLTTVTLPSSLNVISGYAFQNCKELTGIKLPAVMTRIEAKSFTGCPKLGDIRIPEGVELRTEAFNGAGLTSITWPDKPTGKIWLSPFGAQPNIKAMSFPGWMETIPQSICNGWNGLESVTIANGVKYISNQAFGGCGKLKTVDFGTTVKEIGTQAFEGTGLTELNLPDSLEKIDRYGFSKCGSLQSVDFPAGLTTLNSYAFYDCNALKAVRFEEGPAILDSNAFSSCEMLETAVLPSGLTEIGTYAFDGCVKLKYLSDKSDTEFPASLKMIGDYAFQKCESLEKITLLGGMNVGDYAFYLSNLSEIVFPAEQCTFGEFVFKSNDKIREITFPEWMTEIPKGLCTYWTGLETVHFDGPVTKIGESAFEGSPNTDQISRGLLTDFPWPETLREIGPKAFMNCKRDIATDSVNRYFGPVTLYDNVKIGENAFTRATVTKIVFKGCPEIGSDAFSENKHISEIQFPQCMTSIPAGFCKGWGSLTDVILPPEVQEIGADVFYECENLRSIRLPDDDLPDPDNPDEEPTKTIFHLPETIRTIGAGAFYKCSSLKEINLPETDHPLDLQGDSNHRGIFDYCKAVSKIVIPSSVSKIPYRCFNYCQGLKEVVYAPRGGNADLLDIGDYAFNSCSGLSEIALPEMDITLGDHAFAGCSAATRIDWPQSHVLRLGIYCFSECKSLPEVIMPHYIDDIPENAFSGCSKLATVRLSGNEKTIGKAAFDMCPVSDLAWSSDGREPVVEQLCEYAFRQNHLTEVTIPKSVTFIKEACFNNSQELEKLYFEEGESDLNLNGQFVFSNCYKLKEIKFPGRLKTISGKSFINDTALEKLAFAEGLNMVEMEAFTGCTSLRELEISSTVKTFGKECFKNCTNLESVVSKAEDVSFGDSMFLGLKNLRSFVSTGHIHEIMASCFSGCTALSVFKALADSTETSENDWIDEVSSYAFKDCVALTEFPYLKETAHIYSNAFIGCTSLKEIRLPEIGSYHEVRNGWESQTGYFSGDTSLQSIVFPCETTPYFVLTSSDIAGCPLQAISYSYADNIVPLGSEDSTIREYITDGSDVVASPETSILYVKRGQKWKYVDAGYGKVFNIIEMKEPQINIEGDITSQYIDTHEPDEQGVDRYNCNRYQVNLRWKLPLSDLNADGGTVAHLYRDNEEVAKIVFSKPETIKKGEDPQAPDAAGDVVRVAYTVNGKESDFAGDFDYFDGIDPTDNRPLYKQVYMFQKKYLYYDARSHKMLNTMDQVMFEPWFTFVDRFYSKPLDQVDTQESFVYTASIDPYTFMQYRNNDGLTPGDDGKFYKGYEVTFDGDATESVQLQTAMATLHLDVPGLYTFDEVKDDTDQHLPPTSMSDLNSKATLTYSLDPEIVRQKGQSLTNGNKFDMIKSVELRELQDDGKFVSVLKDNNGHTVGTQATGTIDLPRELKSELKPGKTYQLITNSLLRGSFGSKTITIPDVPELTSEMTDLVATPHAMADPNGHTWIPFNTTITVTPDATPTGYTDTLPAADEWHVGIWRTIENDPTKFPEPKPGMQRDVNRPTFEWKTLVHHTDGHVDGNSGSDCSQCRDTWSVDKGTDTLTLTDVFDHGASSFKAIYDTRLYVKVPEKMLNAPDSWMVVDMPVNKIKEDFTGIEEIDARDIRPDDIYYDMQGRIVAHPQPGDILIRLRGSRISKIRLR